MARRGWVILKEFFVGDRFGDFVVPVFIFVAIVFDETSPAWDAARLLLVTAFVIGLIAGRRLELNSFLVVAIFFAALSATSLIWTVAPSTSLDRVHTLMYQVVWLLALMNLFQWKRSRIELGITWVVISAFAAGAQIFLIQGVRFGEVRTIEGVVPPGQLAIAFAAAIAICVFWFSKTRNVWLIIGVLVLSVFLVMTSSRRGLVIAVAFLAVYPIISAKSTSQRVRRLFIGAVTIATAYAAIMLIPFLYSNIGYRVQSFLSFASGDAAAGDASTQGRSWLVTFGLEQFSNSPLIGNGIDSFRELFSHLHGSWSTSADNNYIEILVDLGVVGIIAYYVPLVVFLARTLRGIGHKGREAQFAVAFIIAMVAVDFGMVWFFNNLGLLMFALCYAMIRYGPQDNDFTGSVGNQYLGSRAANTQLL